MRRQPVVKFLEIRDRATFVAAVAVSCELSGNSYDDYLLRRSGYGSQRCILLTRLDGVGKAYNDPCDWDERTWQVAHKYIADNWDEIVDSDVIDVEYILGETDKKKASERHGFSLD